MLACLLCVAIAAPSDPNVARGEAAYRQERWDDASEAFAAAFESTGDPTYLYTRAQAERRAGRCEVAIELFARFVATDPPAQAAAAARDYEAQCRAQIEAEPVEAPAPVAEDEPPEPTTPVTASTPASDPSRDRASARRWSADPWAAAFVGTGAAAIVTGATLAGLAHREAGRAPEAADDEGYGGRIAKAEAFEIAGVTVLSVGAALVIGGVVRWVVLARRGRARAPAVGAMGAGLRISGSLRGLGGRARR